MPIIKQSFVSNLMGKNTYDEFRVYARVIVRIGTIILVILFALTFFVHWDFLCTILSLVTGTSLLFIAYLVALLLLLDCEVADEIPERSYYLDEPKKADKPMLYKLSIVWVVVLITLGLAAIYFSSKYLHNYSFECNTFLVDAQTGIYHLDVNNNCEYAAEASDLVPMRGYEIEERTNCTLCDWCKEWAEEAEHESDRYFRRF